MKITQKISDGLQNVLANLGTRRDKGFHTQYVDNYLSPTELLSIYRNAWVARRGVCLPAEDATRKWRAWVADSDQIGKIEAIEKRLGLQAKTQEALIAARLYGGAAIYINTADGTPEQPMTATKKIVSLVVLTPLVLQPGDPVRDINSPFFGRSEFYKLTNSSTAAQVKIHASRLAIFHGIDAPGSRNASGWGDSVLQSAIDATNHLNATVANIASLVFEAKVDVFRFEGYADMLANDRDDDVTRRLSLQAAMKGINGAVAIDAKDSYEQKTANFGGLPDLISKFQEEVSGAFGIPVTRFFGRSSAGLSGSGEGDERVYYDTVRHEQSLKISPALKKLDECIVTEALGTWPPEVFYNWLPLRETTELERAEIFGKVAQAARTIAGATVGEIIPLDALSDALVNEITELGVLPGLEQRISEYGSLSEQGIFRGGTDT